MSKSKPNSKSINTKDTETSIVIESEYPTKNDEDTQKAFDTNTKMSDKKTDKYTFAASRNHLGNIVLTEKTSEIFESLKKGEICRYGNTGWIIRCPDCGNLVITEDDTHKTYVDPNNIMYRLSPSLVCPKKDCEWHVFGVIKPEGILTPQSTKEETSDQKVDLELTENWVGLV